MGSSKPKLSAGHNTSKTAYEYTAKELQHLQP